MSHFRQHSRRFLFAAALLITCHAITAADDGVSHAIVMPAPETAIPALRQSMAAVEIPTVVAEDTSQVEQVSTYEVSTYEPSCGFASGTAPSGLGCAGQKGCGQKPACCQGGHGSAGCGCCSHGRCRSTCKSCRCGRARGRLGMVAGERGRLRGLCGRLFHLSAGWASFCQTCMYRPPPPGNLHGHMPYDTWRSYYYFRPYQARHVDDLSQSLNHGEMVLGQPFSNEFFRDLHQLHAAKVVQASNLEFADVRQMPDLELQYDNECHSDRCDVGNEQQWNSESMQYHPSSRLFEDDPYGDVHRLFGGSSEIQR